MERRKFTREFKLEAVRLIKQRGVSYVQGSQDLGVHVSQLRDWVKKFADDPEHAFPGHGQMKPEQLVETSSSPIVVQNDSPGTGQSRTTIFNVKPESSCEERLVTLPLTLHKPPIDWPNTVSVKIISSGLIRRRESSARLSS